MHIFLRGSWCNIIVLNVHAPSEEKSVDSKNSFYKEIEQVLFPKYHMKIILGDFKAKAGRKNIFKPTTGNESLQQDSNDNGVIIANFATSKNLVVKSACSRTETFVNTPGPLLMVRLTTILFT